MENEEEVVAHAQKDPEAFGRLYDMYYQPVFGFHMKRTGNVEVAKDLTSETFFQALKNIRRFSPQPDKSFKCWLFAIAVAQVGNYYRSRSKLLAVSAEECPDLVAGEGFEASHMAIEKEELAEREAQAKLLRRMLGQLNPKQQNILSLRFFSHLSIAEIARVMNMKDGTIKSHIHRALKKLHVLMTQRSTQPNAPQCSGKVMYATQTVS